MPRLAATVSQLQDAVAHATSPAAHLPTARYAPHRPERTLLYSLVQAHYPDFIVRLEAEDRPLPEYVREEFETYLRCGVLEHGFLRVVCEQCRAERLVAYSCKKRGFCPSCGARRMAESARHLVEEVFGPRPCPHLCATDAGRQHHRASRVPAPVAPRLARRRRRIRVPVRQRG